MVSKFVHPAFFLFIFFLLNKMEKGCVLHKKELLLMFHKMVATIKGTAMKIKLLG